MVRQTKCRFVLVLFLAAALGGLLVPASVLAGPPGGGGSAIGNHPGDPQLDGGSGGGGLLGSGDPDELGIYRMQSALPGENPGPAQVVPPRAEPEPGEALSTLRMLWRFLLGYRVAGL